MVLIPRDQVGDLPPTLERGALLNKIIRDPVATTPKLGS